MNLPKSTKYVNTTFPKQGLNEVTMQFVPAVHCSGLSWRDLHKFATVFDIAVELSLQGAADELNLRVDSIPSPVPNCINTAVSFDSSWETREYYSNARFGSAISARTKKVLDYVLLNRTSEKCNRWSRQRQNEHPEQYIKWYNTHQLHCLKNHSRSSQSMEPEACQNDLG
ncbi:hypothetical protein LOD99_10522 [Oopsacas minuta]|uniref:Mutator-like transposase domain-containing protein n=1 Tax=Oopsacas minuta TaxID=111878 RepID=A0AAV7KHF9_9METZ|nr:hypothetical protein LOD99_10522 [Oopsacas minuta]